MKFLGSLGPVIHDTRGQSNVQSYATKRKKARRFNGTYVCTHTYDVTRCTHEDACMHFEYARLRTLAFRRTGGCFVDRW